MIRAAACSCGGLTVRCEGEPVRISVCHCLACQRRTGSVFGAQARFPSAKVTIEGVATEYVRIGDGGGKITFRFCPICGSTVYYDIDTMPDLIAVTVGTFADPSFPMPTVSVHEERRHGWVQMPEQIEQN